ncbi:hypothetical protein Ait01nite_097820 [Actinoplanes italicus]|uniref:Uncharacterized protein n=1 Tax=Actinoplanes italicus TaxID=113567 RepID=A0A2T0K418_9ACTN|nr:DUF5984 family protein [Actinoplanes italicus]PRX17370.1 hypothetical protein CLV67_116146 [Actinoplanes italicus]GIE36737.1 hypothetical protein Ait01nite_097820 [Actinoplanes italicus]
MRPLDDAESWDGDPPSLSWFGLTDGWYWIEAGGHELLRRTRFDSEPDEMTTSRRVRMIATAPVVPTLVR